MEREKLISLVSAAQSGDGDAMNELFNAFYNDVYFFALKTCADEDTACEVTQETFIEVINTIGHLQEPAAFVTWMKQITYHQCTRFFKKQKSRGKYETLAEENEDGVSVLDFAAEDRQDFIPDEAVDQKEFRQAILGMLDQLSEEQRSAMMLYYYDELSIKQIAQIQNVSESAVKSRLFYGRKFMKQSVEDYEKKNDIKLHSCGLFPLFIWLFQGGKKMAGGMAAGVAAHVTAATGTAIAITAGASGAAGVAAATGFGAFLASIPLGIKVTAAALTLTLAVGGTAAVISNQPAPEPKQPVLATMPHSATIPTETTVPTTIPGETIPDETTPEETTPEETTPEETTPEETTPEETIPETEPPETTVPETEPPETTVPETEPPEPTVPSGGTYTTADGTTYQSGETLPEITVGDKLVTADYTYTYSSSGWAVRVSDRPKTSYESLLGEVNGMPLTDMSYTFASCSALTRAPVIPNSVKVMNDTFFNCNSLAYAPDLPDGVLEMTSLFDGCTALTEAPVIPNGVTDLHEAFFSCTSLTQAPVIPEGVTNLYRTFSNCNSMTQAPVIPNSVTNMEDTFAGCFILTQAPVIPNSVTNMAWAFSRCPVLSQAPVIPNSVTNLSGTFSECGMLTQAPVIPSSVTNMDGTFKGCTMLTQAPVIPNSVTNLTETFLDCTRLTGTVIIHANPTIYHDCFSGTIQPITLTGSSTVLNELADTDSDENVTVGE